jgi:alanyl aminopeptidase
LPLGNDVVPRSYSLDLSINPALESLSGMVAIQVDVLEPTAVLRMHGEGMSFDEVSFRAAGNGEWEPAAVREVTNGGLSVELPHPLERGSAELRWRYRAPLPEAPNGIYRAQDQGHWYAFTQFEPIEARRAFPCFDQPNHKTPFRVTLRVPEGNLAFSNAPEISSSLSGNWRVFQFAETRPLPTYLVAFAVGPFDVRKAPEGTAAALRTIATRGKGAFADQALGWTPRILRELTDYFGAPYPFQKLDQVAVPNFAAGAMENVGLVTYRESLLLLDAAAPVQDRLSSQSVIAHELAHMWFGNLVTMPWWDDVWLNESFATWLAPKVVAQVSPEFEAQLSRVTDAQRAMTLDSRRAARSIRQPVREEGDIYNAFDGITYAKGAAVLSMLEAWVGTEPFRAGLQRYMQEHAYGLGTTSDVLSRLELASGKPVARVARGFLEQPGTPNISIKAECTSAPGQQSSLTLTQTRYLPQGSRAPQGKPWSVPVCIRHGNDAGGAPKRECLLLEGAQQSFSIEACPSWIVPNVGAQGYYRWQLPPEAVKALAGAQRQQLELPELLALPGDLGALVESQLLPAEDYLAALARVATEAHPRVVAAVIGELEKVYETAVDDPLKPGFAGWVRELLGPHQQRIGTSGAASESPSIGLLRPALLYALGSWGQDPKLRALAQRSVEAYLNDPSSVSSEELANWLPIVAETGDAALWEKLRARLVAAQSPSERRILVSALGRFEDDVLVRQSLGLVLDGQLRGQDFRTLVGAMRPRARLQGLAWLETNYQALLERIGDKAAPRLPDIGHGLCTEESHARLERYFAPLAKRVSGLDRNLNLVLEGVEQCMIRRAYVYPALSARFAAYP